MNTIPKGFKIEKTVAIPESVQKFRSSQVKWEWLRERLRTMTEGSYYRLICPDKKEADCARTAIRNFAARQKKNLPPALQVEYRTYGAKMDGSKSYEVYIEVVKADNGTS